MSIFFPDKTQQKLFLSACFLLSPHRFLSEHPCYSSRRPRFKFPLCLWRRSVLVVREHGHLIELLLHWSFGVMLSLSCLLNPNSFNQVGKRLEARSCSRGLFLTPQERTEDVGINQQGAQVNLGLLRQGRDISVDAQCAHVL